MDFYTHIVVIGASTGGIDALKQLVSGLPTGFPAPIAIVQHTGAQSPNSIADIISRESRIEAEIARNGQLMAPGRVYVAPADHHLLVTKDGRLLTARGPKENRFRPAIDPLFRSAAAAFGPRVIGVILTGLLDDGTAGLWAVRRQGGTAIVQNPEEAVAPSMPLNALKNVEVNHCVRIADLAPLLVRLTSQGGTPAESPPKIPARMATEIQIAAEQDALRSGITHWGSPSLFTCPECHGVLLELEEGKNLRYRCHTGHAYSIETLLDDYRVKTETMLWTAVRAYDELVLLLGRMATRLEQRGEPDQAAALRRRARENAQLGNRVREVFRRPGETAGNENGEDTSLPRLSDS